jgi:hypothetical protein
VLSKGFFHTSGNGPTEKLGAVWYLSLPILFLPPSFSLFYSTSFSFYSCDFKGKMAHSQFSLLFILLFALFLSSHAQNVSWSTLTSSSLKYVELIRFFPFSIYSFCHYCSYLIHPHPLLASFVEVVVKANKELLFSVIYLSLFICHYYNITMKRSTNK